MIKEFQKWFLYFIPISLVFSIFVADALVVLTLIFFIIYQIQNKSFVIFSNKYFIFFIFFWIYLIFNSIFSYDVNLSLSRSLPYIRFGILFLAIGYMMNYEKFKNNFLKYTLIVLLLVCADAIIQFLFGRNLLGYQAHVSRISGFFNDELVLGGFLLKMYPIFLISLVYFKHKISINLIQLCFFLFIYFFAIYLSGERTAFFNFILFNIFLLLILFKKKYIKHLFSFLLIFPIIFVVVAKNNNHISERYLSVKKIFNFKDPIIFSENHENHYKSALNIFKSHPILGSGLKTFRLACKKPEHNPIGCTTHPHNILMLFLSELGLVGATFYLIAFFYFGAKLLQLFLARFKNDHVDNSLMLVIINVSMFISLWPLSPSGNYFNNWLSILNFLPMGFLIYYDENKSKF
jgi:O-antigen ligase